MGSSHRRRAGSDRELIAAVSAERGYLLAGNSEYAANYNDARTAITQRIDELTRLVF
jgi:CHASE3 domain sensor protein